MIHEGFYDAWYCFKDDLDKLFRKLFKAKGNDFNSVRKRLCITGHSRGGALASLCARHFAKNRRKESSCWTFGAPAQGKQAYVTQYNRLPLQHYRIVNGYDIVPDVPPASMGFRHQNRLIHLRQPLWHKWFGRIRDHCYSTYTKGLMRYCKDCPESIKQLKIVKRRAFP